MNIALVGKTGSGKSALAKKLASQFGFEIVDSTIWRDYISSKGEGWEIVQKAFTASKDMPVGLFKKAIELRFEKSAGEGYLVDNAFNSRYMKVFEKNHKIDIAIYLDVSDDVANNRVLKRRREKDVLMHLRNRKKLFDKNLPELEKYFDGRIVKIDAGQNEDTIFDQVKEIIKDLISVKTNDKNQVSQNK